MILPTRHVRPERALIGVGAEILQILNQPITVSRLWNNVCGKRAKHAPNAPIHYQWFILALDLLYTLGTIDFECDQVEKTKP